MTALVGIIAEDVSDIGVVNALIKKIATKKYGTKSFVGHGCGRLRNKYRAWAKHSKIRAVNI
jgi:hypothetical protein